VIQQTAHRKRPLSPERMSKIDSTLARVEEITTEMRRQANSSGKPYRHSAALRQACALLEPSIGLSTFYRYRVLSSEYHLDTSRYWLSYLDILLTRRSGNDGTEE
jgi:hypothetical protein